jgi:pimeloyl-ACP methyl ester carboxylesterase
VSKVLDLLTSPESNEHPAFHVVALSLPGYGFSEAPKKPGFNLVQYAEVRNGVVNKPLPIICFSSAIN